MSEQFSPQRLHQAVTLANAGQRREAAEICREVVAAEPNNTSALLWLAFTSDNPGEIESAINRAKNLAPQDPAVSQALNWYNTTYSSPPVVSSSPAPITNKATTVTAAPKAVAEKPALSELASDAKHKRIGEPIRDGTNFFMTQTGGLLLASIVFFCGSFLSFLVFSGILKFLLTGDASYGTYYNSSMLIRIDIFTIVSLIVAIAALLVFVYAMLDVLTPTVKAYGTVKHRQYLPIILRDRDGSEGGQIPQYEVSFTPDAPDGHVAMPVKLIPTQAQYEASGYSSRAYVEFSKRLGRVKVYQLLDDGSPDARAYANGISPNPNSAAKPRMSLIWKINIVVAAVVAVVLVIGIIFSINYTADQQTIPVYPNATVLPASDEVKKAFADLRGQQGDNVIITYYKSSDPASKIATFFTDSFSQKNWTNKNSDNFARTFRFNGRTLSDLGWSIFYYERSGKRVLIMLMPAGTYNQQLFQGTTSKDTIYYLLTVSSS